MDTGPILVAILTVVSGGLGFLLGQQSRSRQLEQLRRQIDAVRRTFEVDVDSETMLRLRVSELEQRVDQLEVDGAARGQPSRLSPPRLQQPPTPRD